MKWVSTALNSGLKNYGAGLTAFTSDLFLSLLSITRYRVKENISERKPRALTRNSTALMNSSKEKDKEKMRDREGKREQGLRVSFLQLAHSIRQHRAEKRSFFLALLILLRVLLKHLKKKKNDTQLVIRRHSIKMAGRTG